MHPKDKAEFRRHVEASIEALSRQLPSLKESSRPVAPDNALGRLTRLDAMQSQAINLDAYQKLQGQLAGLNHALARIDDPDFGLCAACDEPIPPGRLQAMPGARHCVNCA